MVNVYDILLVLPENVSWEIVSRIQIKRCDCGRRMALDEAGPLTSLPLLGSVQRFAVEVIYKDFTWDRTHWLDDPIEAHRIANKMSLIHSLPVQWFRDLTSQITSSRSQIQAISSLAPTVFAVDDATADAIRLACNEGASWRGRAAPALPAYGGQ